MMVGKIKTPCRKTVQTPLNKIGRLCLEDIVNRLKGSKVWILSHITQGSLVDIRDDIQK